jgi:hypothetical protein
LHSSAARIGKKFLQIYSRGGDKILEIGSRDVNGGLRQFMPDGSIWVGIDIEPGPGVDHVVPQGGPWPFRNESFDLVIASSVFEHDLAWWETLVEISRVIRKTGFVYINAPSNGPVHRYPVDAFRFYPDAGLSMVQIFRKSYSPNARLQESFTAEQDQGEDWNDFVCVVSGGKGDKGVDCNSRIWHSEKCTNVRDGEEYLNSTLSEITEDGRELATLRKEKIRAQQLLDELLALRQSLSWKITLPIRKLLPVLKMAFDNLSEILKK